MLTRLNSCWSPITSQRIKKSSLDIRYGWPHRALGSLTFRAQFFVMGALDSLQGLFIVVGGVQVPGIMQNLLLQGAVPVTMLCSILFLRSRGCQQCKQTRDTLAKCARTLLCLLLLLTLM